MTERLSANVVRRRAKSSVFFVGSWGVVNLVVGFGGSLILARALTPEDFGIVAVGATMMTFATALAEGGLGSGLIRREDPPTRAELRTALGLQLTLTTTLGLICAAVAARIGGAGLVVALMMGALPIAALQTPGRVVLSREMRFRALATVEAVGTALYYVWAVAGVVAGFGVWALATGTVVKALVTAVGIMRVSGLARVVPSYRGTRAMRSVVAFGLRFQAVSLAGVGREQGLNGGVAMIGGVPTLGLFSLARRVLELPVLIFEPLHRVAFPYMSHMLASRQDPSRVIQRGIGVSAAASGVLLAGVAAAVPELVPAVFGEQWRAAGTIVPWICLALLVAGPLSVVGVGFLYAAGEPSVVLRAVVLHTIALYVVAFSLLGAVGPAAIGMGSFAGAVVDALVMARALSQRTSTRPLRALLPLVAIATAAGLAGLAASDAAGTGFVSAILGGATASALCVAGLAAFQRRVLAETAGMVLDSVRAGLTRERPIAAAAEAT